jgi:hypothetical protein
LFTVFSANNQLWLLGSFCCWTTWGNVDHPLPSIE